MLLSIVIITDIHNFGYDQFREGTNESKLD